MDKNTRTTSLSVKKSKNTTQLDHRLSNRELWIRVREQVQDFQRARLYSKLAVKRTTFA